MKLFIALGALIARMIATGLKLINDEPFPRRPLHS
jgi:hypothetical protein